MVCLNFNLMLKYGVNTNSLLLTFLNNCTVIANISQVRLAFSYSPGCTCRGQADLSGPDTNFYYSPIFSQLRKMPDYIL